MVDGVGKPRSYGKYEIFDDETDALSWDAAEKNAHEHLRRMGLPVSARPENVAIIPPRPVHPELEREKEERSVPRAPKPPTVKHKKLGEGESSLPPLERIDHKLEAIARAHILLHWLRDNVCKDNADAVKWIDEILNMAPQSS